MAKRLHAINRRGFLQAGAVAAAASAVPWSARAEEGGIAVTPLGSDSAVVTGAGENIFATQSDDGLILVDTGAQDHAPKMLAALADHFGGRRVAAAFNTHWHHANTGGNAAVRQQGASIHSHENTRLWLSGDFYSRWEDRRYRPQPEAMLPTETFYTDGAKTLGGREVEYKYLRLGHTDGDIAVRFPDEDVIVAGGLVSVGSYPVMDYVTGGWIGGMSEASEALLEMAGPDTKIIPGVGPVVGRSHLEKQTEMLVTVRERAFAAVRKGHGVEEMLGARITEEFDAEWGDPTEFIVMMYPGLGAHAYEVGGVV